MNDSKIAAPPLWPHLRSYSGGFARRISMPLGGIGTGTIGIGGRGDLRSWEIFNEPAENFRPVLGFFAIRTKSRSGVTVSRVLEGPIDHTDFEGPFGAPVDLAGLPRFRSSRFDVAYPLATVHLQDSDVPLSVRLEAFNPLIPTNEDASGIPVAILRYVCTNLTEDAIDVSICGTLDNLTGGGGQTARTRLRQSTLDLSASVNEQRAFGNNVGVYLHSPNWNRHSSSYGEMAIALVNPSNPSFRTQWRDLSWGDSLLDFWEDFTSDGALDEVGNGEPRVPVASLNDQRTLAPGESQSFTFIISWRFPNRRAWTGGLSERIDFGELSDDIIGNYYSTRFASAWEVVSHVTESLESLERRTVAFVSAVCDSGLPISVTEAALFNVSTLRTETCFRTPDGRLFGWEGIGSDRGSCFGSCTHVWNYEYVTPFLFGALARNMRDTEFAHATDFEGKMSFRVGLPLESNARKWDLAAADGQMGSLVRVFREWRLSGDDSFLARLWPKVRLAMEFCWLPGSWDADQDGVMEGVQHNTMDVEYFGPNPQMGFWYLAALRAVEEMARHEGDEVTAEKCNNLFERGSNWIDKNLFNGTYFRQEIHPVDQLIDVHPGLRHPGMGADDMSNPELQLGDGCLVDQLVGQLAAHVAGLGYLGNENNVKSALNAVSELNWLPDMHNHFNQMRSFALGDESGLLMAAYPEGVLRPSRPFPYSNEVMTGFEYTAALGLAFEGELDAAERIFRSIRSRYDGDRRNPFDEAECGRHYVRPMASWAAIVAWTGFNYDGRTGEMTLSDTGKVETRVWATGNAWGTCSTDHKVVTVSVYEGQLFLKRLNLGNRSFESGRDLRSGDVEIFN
jgi:non-lysosomal glucosylceramidase